MDIQGILPACNGMIYGSARSLNTDVMRNGIKTLLSIKLLSMLIFIAISAHALEIDDWNAYVDNSEEKCSDQEELDCLLSKSCIVGKVGNDSKFALYKCIMPRNKCEDGFIQFRGHEETCQKKNDCLLQENSCYCPPDMACGCGGGRPPMCEVDMSHNKSLKSGTAQSAAP